MKKLHLKFIPTGNVFVLPEEVAKEFLKSDRGNYQIVDEDFVEEVEEIKETTVYEQVVEEQEETQEDFVEEVEEKPKRQPKRQKKVE